MVPAQVVDAGCIIEHDAPGGCIGAVEISGVSIPAVTIPGAVLSEVEAADGRTLARTVLEPVTLPAVTVPPVRAPQVCQVATKAGVPTVTRPGIVRPAATRSGGARPGFTRPSLCGRGGCLPELRVEAVRIPPVRVPDVDVDPRRLRGRDLSAEVEVLEGPQTTAYIAGGDVLFETDRATLRPEAVRVLRDIAKHLGKSVGTLVVEGHTDSRGTRAHNVDLSRRRAAAVADWLRSGGLDPSTRLVVRGLGEAAPAHSNATEEGRERNRRVVITVSQLN
jgi:outer membrane protein OmpA-like peptidoglycan-associated protein